MSMDYSVYGCCLTIPWGNKDPDAPGNPTRADAAKIWRRWTHHLGRLLDAWNIGIIYRVELQTRRAVHWHMMVYLPNRVDLQAIVNALAQSIMKVKCSLTTARKKSGRSMIDCGSNVGHAYLMHLLRLSWINAINQVHDEIKTGAAWSALVAPVAPGSDHAARQISSRLIIASTQYLSMALSPALHTSPATLQSTSKINLAMMVSNGAILVGNGL